MVTFDDLKWAMGTAGAALAWLASAGAIVNFFASRIADRMLMKYRAELDRDLAAHKATFDRELELLRAANAHRIHVNKTQYDIELTAYREVWAPLAETVAIVAQFNQRFSLDPPEVFEAKRAANAEAFGSVGTTFLETARRMQPFLAPDVAAGLDDLVRDLNLVVAGVRLGEPIGSDLTKGIDIGARANSIRDAIRNRIAGLEAAGGSTITS